MSIWKNGKLVAGGRQTTPLLSFMWADHILDDISWLRADTFSWQSGLVYQAVYQHLANDIDGKSLQSETIGATTIWFYLADDGHKIVPVNNANLVEDIYNATGVAWYYILDTVNQRFKLPRTKFGFTGLRDTVGNYVDAGLPNITGLFYGQNAALTGGSGAFFTGNNPYGGTVSAGSANNQMQFNANRSSSIYGNSTTVQPPATQMYLYFYVGTFTQTALENTAGITAETLNDKADLSYTNAQLATKVDKGHEVIAFQAPNAGNNYIWYRKYADGWVEQGGQFIATSVADGSGTAGNNIINLPIEMANNRYWYSANAQVGGSGWEYVNGVMLNARATTTLTLKVVAGTGDVSLYWEVKGMAA